MHKPIAAKDARKLLDARTAVDTEWKKLTHLPAWDSKKVKPKSEVVQQAKKDGRSVHVAIPMNFCHLKHSELAKHLHRYKGRCSRRDDVKDDSGTEQFSQNQELQLFKWQQQHILDASARLCGMAGDQRRGIGIHARTHVRSPHAIAIARRRAPTSVDKTACHPVGDRNNWTRLKNQWFVFSNETWTATLWQDCCRNEDSKKYFSDQIGEK